MKKIFLKLIKSAAIEVTIADTEHALRVATAILLVEVARADFKLMPAELAHMRSLLQQQFALAEEELDELLAEAQQGADRLVSLQHITRLLNENFDQPMKLRVIEMLWELVYADEDKNHYEEHLIRQIAELLYISHSDFIRARHKAEPAD